MSFIDELNHLDPSNPGLWPLPIKMLMFLVAFVAVLAVIWYMSIVPIREEIARLQQEEETQIEVLEVRQKKAANLEPLEEQMQEMEQSLGDMVRQLPDKTEVAGLLVDISQTGLSAGLEFREFRPKALVPQEFYSTLPIEIQTQGGYHQMAEFISGLAALPRIVTVHDVRIESKEDASRLSMTMVAKTYQAVSSEEEEEL